MKQKGISFSSSSITALCYRDNLNVSERVY